MSGRGLITLVGVMSLVACASREPLPKTPADGAPKAEATDPSDPPSARECVSFTSKVNETLRKVMDITQSKAENDEQMIADMNALGSLYEQLARDIADLPIESSALKKHTNEYREMCGKAANAARRVGVAIRTKNLSQAQAAEKDFDQVVKQEDVLVDRINRLCKTETVAS